MLGNISHSKWIFGVVLASITIATTTTEKKSTNDAVEFHQPVWKCMNEVCCTLAKWNVIYHSSRSDFTGVLAFFSSKFVKNQCLMRYEVFREYVRCSRAPRTRSFTCYSDSESTVRTYTPPKRKVLSFRHFSFSLEFIATTNTFLLKMEWKRFVAM